MEFPRDRPDSNAAQGLASSTGAPCFGRLLTLPDWLPCRRPDYHGPPPGAVVNAPAANAPFISGAGDAFSPEPASGAWWRLYESADLDRLVSEAFAANTDLRMAQANLERSQALLRGARAARQPMAEINFDPQLPNS